MITIIKRDEDMMSVGAKEIIENNKYNNLFKIRHQNTLIIIDISEIRNIHLGIEWLCQRGKFLNYSYYQ